MTREKVSVVLITLLSVSHGARILGLFPFPARSHKAISAPLMRELAERGHEVTVISPYPENPPCPNLTDIPLKELDYRKHKLPESLFEIRGAFTYVNNHWEMGVSITNSLLEDSAAQDIIYSRDKEFDLIIVEAFFNEAFLGFAHKFKAPIIQVSTIVGATWVGDWFGNPAPYSFMPDNYLNYGDRMNFWQRCVNTIIGTYFRLGRQFYYLPKQEAIMRNHFRALRHLPPLSELESSTSLILLNHHFTLSHAKPLMPNMIQVGGMHIKPPRKLPEVFSSKITDLQEFMDEASDGVIYFSMGTHLRSTQMSKTIRESFLQTFSKLKQRVIWKLENGSLQNHYKNVKLATFLPQFDLLNHPKMRLFITHCGISSIQEAAYCGIPVIGVPIFGDQGHNCVKAITADYGVVLDYGNITADSVYNAIQEMMRPRYRRNAQRLSRIYRDQPHTPLQRAVFWTEYVIRHKGASHMRSAALSLTWYQYCALDVIAVFVLVICSSLWIIFFVVRKLQIYFRFSRSGKLKTN